MNTEKLTGKVIVITGAASGMGAAMAKDFSAREAKVAILDMNEEKAQEVIKEIEAAGGVATFYKIWTNHILGKFCRSFKDVTIS